MSLRSALLDWNGGDTDTNSWDDICFKTGYRQCLYEIVKMCEDRMVIDAYNGDLLRDIHRLDDIDEPIGN